MYLTSATGDIVKEVIARMPTWVFTIIGISVIILFFYISYLLSKGARQITKVLDKESNIKEMQEQIRTLDTEYKFKNEVSSLYHTALGNVASHIKTLSDIRYNKEERELIEVHNQIKNLLNRIIDSMAADMKFDPGEMHRCGLWLYQSEDRTLVLIHASAGFQTEHVNNKSLNVDHSIAGRAFRLKRTIKEDEVNNSYEWYKSSPTTSKYKAILAVPVGELGVVTVDAKNVVRDELEIIAEAYTKVIELCLKELLTVLRLMTEQRKERENISSFDFSSFWLDDDDDDDDDENNLR